MTASEVLIVGGGLAGCECAWQLAERGIEVTLVEQRPERTSPAHSSDNLAELVCSNSLRGASLSNAVGALKEELRLCNSLIMRAADAERVPAGGALAVDRDRFAQTITQWLHHHPRVRLVRQPVSSIPEQRPCVIATGPLTSDDLASDIAHHIGHASLSYYDAIAPIIAADSIDWDVVFRQSRFDREESGEEQQQAAYVNCPFDEQQYRTFVQALRETEKVQAHAFEKATYFEGCLPIEVMAERGEMTLAFGPMKPVGLTDPKTGRRPFAVVQLRPETQDQTAFNMVGFQTRMTHAAQQIVLRTIPGLERASFLRMGSVHRNTFVDAPRVLDETLQLKVLPGVYLAGQITGVEGYVESSASGLACGIMLAATLAGRAASPPPNTTLLGGLLGHLARQDQPFQPSNVTWAHVPALPKVRGRGKEQRRQATAELALQHMRMWIGAELSDA